MNNQRLYKARMARLEKLADKAVQIANEMQSEAA